ncbi:MAG: threonine--tRNA ligase [Candidatus Liptonbacteria bacterium RIFOXYC1_FULL_36_8]|uniref:Threonine--tRNA ligase n=2 Tax=Candidatus Liptoniibacteriota TaxID=1817909 RepID=A0A1G2CRL1_9BACT|nr:MAG: threonine--tRNA ligase [Candidatus Liptonbacteria bacterium RIFOXYD1_FULL_36_11]OGZ03078.1 MAG: threonine--tRNA ligase [Candidatus Liptonbacteria bacterium RIFOXYC1_FULL_36_8]
MPKQKSNNLEKIRHSLSHLLAAAVLEIFPDTKLGIGPVIEDGFYYDFLLSKKLSSEDLPRLENKIRELIKQNLPFKKENIIPVIARKLFQNQPFKLELIEDLKKSKSPISIYKTGDIFTDLCAGPHIKNTKEILENSFKILKIAGAYWKGNEKNQMLTRIYGLAFSSKKELEEKIKQLEEAERRDHRKLGQELDLFIFSDLVGPGLPLYTPKGTIIRNKIADFSRTLRREMNYEEVRTPQINKAELFKKSGHYEKYKDDMFRAVSNYTDEEYFLKPMNCPQHVQIYASKLRSYTDLPVRLADFATLYRDEKPGELSGLTRLRAFSQDDSHCFCREDQIKPEFDMLLSAINKAMKTYGMSYYIRLSLRDEKNKEKYLGDNATWKKSQKILESLLKEKKIKYVTAVGEAAFYGPKMDLIAKDSLGREWQLSTIQIDFNMPKRFEISFIGKDGKKYTPVMIHSALVGSPERFMGVLIEHFSGAFPVWLSPIQTTILPISEKSLSYAEKLLKALKEKNIRAELDKTNETIGKKIRNAEISKIPYMLIVGERETENKTVSVRRLKEGNLGASSLSDFISKISSEISEKK